MDSLKYLIYADPEILACNREFFLAKIYITCHLLKSEANFK